MKETLIRVYIRASSHGQRVCYQQAAVILDDTNNFKAIRMHQNLYHSDQELKEEVAYSMLVSSKADIVQVLKKHGFQASGNAPTPKCTSLHVSISSTNEKNILAEASRRNVTKSYIVEEILNEKYGEKSVCLY